MRRYRNGVRERADAERRRGNRIGICMIAAIAFALGNCTVVSADSDLLAVPGLTVENWSTRRVG